MVQMPLKCTLQPSMHAFFVAQRTTRTPRSEEGVLGGRANSRATARVAQCAMVRQQCPLRATTATTQGPWVANPGTRQLDTSPTSPPCPKMRWITHAPWGLQFPHPPSRGGPLRVTSYGGLSEARVAGPHANLWWLATGGGGLIPMRPSCSPTTARGFKGTRRTLAAPHGVCFIQFIFI